VTTIAWSAAAVLVAAFVFVETVGSVFAFCAAAFFAGAGGLD
jgi:hypothetical protein